MSSKLLFLIGMKCPMVKEEPYSASGTPGAHFWVSWFRSLSACLGDRAWDEIPDAFRLYVNPGTAVEAGLRRRRRQRSDFGFRSRLWEDS